MVISFRAAATIGVILTVVGVSVGTLSGPAVASTANSSAENSSTSDSTSTQAPDSPLQVLTIGDSIMNGHGLPRGQAWPYLVASADGWIVDNQGCDGAGVLTPGDPAKCGSDYAGIIRARAATHPDIVIIQGSSNDFGQSNRTLLAETITDLEALKAEFPTSQIVGLSTLWGSTYAPAQTADTDSQVKKAVENVGGTYIDLGQPMFGHPELMQADDVHPNAAGQAVLAADIETMLTKAVDAAIETKSDEAATSARAQQLFDLGLVQ
jgi:acyl-CoA thioesterase-1